ncbi:LysR substrate-binding domain-containing protein [Serratia sp. L9]|uniref:LysR substrate-binding domain-containing protein n=1 Tax=Serratia sp. L9 TaxID=3423946 RepID=UPI003D67FD93
MLPSAIERFQKRFPQISVNLTEGQVSDLLPALRAGKLDFVIGTSSPASHLNIEFIEEPFFTAPCGVLARIEHPLAQSTSLSQLSSGKWYLPATKTGYYHHLQEVLFPDGRQVGQQIIHGDTAIMAMQMVLDADFLTVAAKEIVQVPYLNSKLKVIPIEDFLPDASYNFIYSRRLPLTQVSRVMLNELLRECRNYPWHNKIQFGSISSATAVAGS